VKFREDPHQASGGYGTCSANPQFSQDPRLRRLGTLGRRYSGISASLSKKILFFESTISSQSDFLGCKVPRRDGAEWRFCAPSEVFTIFPHTVTSYRSRGLLLSLSNMKLESTSIIISELLLRFCAAAPYFNGQTRLIFFFRVPQLHKVNSLPQTSPFTSVFIIPFVMTPASALPQTHCPSICTSSTSRTYPPLHIHPSVLSQSPSPIFQPAPPHIPTSTVSPPSPKIKFEAERVCRGAFASSAPNRHPRIHPQSKNRTRPKTPRTKFQLYLKSPSSAVDKLLTPPVVGLVFVWDCLTLREGGCDLSAYLFHLPVLLIHLESFGQECECLPVNSAPVKPCQKSTTACLGSLGKDNI
jgi:hypothetical protein